MKLVKKIANVLWLVGGLFLFLTMMLNVFFKTAKIIDPSFQEASHYTDYEKDSIKLKAVSSAMREEIKKAGGRLPSTQHQSEADAGQAGGTFLMRPLSAALYSDEDFKNDASYAFLFFDLDCPANAVASEKIMTASINTYVSPDHDLIRNVRYYEEGDQRAILEQDFQKFLNGGKKASPIPLIPKI